MDKCEVYHHSGKFGVHGPILAILASIPVALLLGLLYAYLVKWIPFIYINFFITLGYSFAFGIGAGLLLKLCKVRNGAVALLTGLIVGLIALYFDWNGHILALVPKSEKLPWLLSPGIVIEVMKELYKEGSWGIGFNNSGNVTGIVLGIVWFIEAVIVVGIATLVPWTMITSTPYCEENQCWLDEEKKIETLQPISDPETLEQLKAGNISALASVPAKVPGASDFTRVTVKHSPNSNCFFTVHVENVVKETDKEGKEVEKTNSLSDHLMIPGPAAEFIKQIERVRQTPLPT